MNVVVVFTFIDDAKLQIHFHQANVFGLFLLQWWQKKRFLPPLLRVAGRGGGEGARKKPSPSYGRDGNY